MMKKLTLTLIVTLLLPLFTSAQMSVTQGGTGRNSFTSGAFIYANSDAFQRLTGTTTPFFSSFSWGNATGTSATTTSFFSTTASSTNLFSTTGNIGTLTAGPITSGLINGQTISSAANFTGTAAISTSLSIAGGTALTTTNQTGTGSLVLATSPTITTPTISGGSVTLSQDTNFVLSGGTNGASFDSTTLSVDAANDRVGIGTAAPAGLLDIRSSSNINSFIATSNTNGQAVQRFVNDVQDWSFGVRGDVSDSFVLRDVTTGADRLTIESSGEVGIGTTGPSSKVDVEITARATTFDANDATTWADLQIRNPQDTLSAATGIGFVIDGTTDSIGAGIAAIKNHATNQASNLAFVTRAVGGNLLERMRIDTSGNVGIGTTSPSTKLEIDTGSNTSGLRLLGAAETTEIADIFVGTGGELILSTKSGADGSQYLDLRGEDNDYGIIVRDSSGGTESSWANIYMNDATTDYLHLVVNSTNTANTGLVIDDNNNIGIGDTTPSGKLDIFTSSTRYVRVHEAGSLGDLQVVTDNGVLPAFTVKGTGTADLVNIFDNTTEVFTILDGGNVGIGTSTPDQQFHFYSTINASQERFIIEGRRDGLYESMTIRSRDGGSPTTALAENHGGGIYFRGFDGTDFEQLAAIYATPDGQTIANGDSPGALRFYTTPDGSGMPTEKMRITASGNVGIGTTTPTVMLAVQNASEGNTLQLYDTDGNCRIDPDSGGLTTTCSSDRRLKTDIRDASSALKYLSDFRIRDYKVKSSGDKMTGVIAQELLVTHPELVVTQDDGYYGVKEVSSWKLIKAIQELWQKVRNHESRLDRLERENRELKARLEALERRN